MIIIDDARKHFLLLFAIEFAFFVEGTLTVAVGSALLWVLDSEKVILSVMKINNKQPSRLKE